AYAAKYASALYGPFRDAVDVTIVGGGDRKGYQQDPRNGREALEEIRADLAEGADIVMVKPALAYLDIIAKARAEVDVPLAAYQVSGEYTMVKAAGANGWIDEDAVALEHLWSIKRAGADMILTYFARQIAETLNA
ncbi:MAG: porphobilinogen synthase, partial [Acidimicrobiales bacterium]